METADENNDQVDTTILIYVLNTWSQHVCNKHITKKQKQNYRKIIFNITNSNPKQLPQSELRIPEKEWKFVTIIIMTK